MLLRLNTERGDRSYDKTMIYVDILVSIELHAYVIDFSTNIQIASVNVRLDWKLMY